MVSALRRLTAFARAIHLALREAKNLQTLPERAAWQQRQARRMLAALEIQTIIHGNLPVSGLIVSNHLSYIDILVIAAQGPVVFIAKSDVRDWPVIGLLLKHAGTILAERQRPMSAGKTAAEIREALHQNLPVVLFPEGTSSDGSNVLPFKPTLLQAALDADIPITPAAISYRSDSGNPKTDICYWGEASFFPHLIRLAGLSRIQAYLAFGDPRQIRESRKPAAASLHREVSRLLDLC